MQQVLTGDIFESIHQRDNAQLIYEAAGQSVFAIEGETTIANQMRTLVADMNAAHKRLQALAH
jgi:hypothetical protein